jgi:hypothetical protein
MAALNFMMGAAEGLRVHLGDRAGWWEAYAPILDFAHRMTACTTDGARTQLCQRLPAELVALRGSREPAITDWGSAVAVLLEFLNAPSPDATYNHWHVLAHAGPGWEQALVSQFSSDMHLLGDKPFYVTDINITGQPTSVAGALLESVAPTTEQGTGAGLLGGAISFDVHVVAFHPCTHNGAANVVVTDSTSSAGLVRFFLDEFLAKLRREGAAVTSVTLVFAAPGGELPPLPDVDDSLEMDMGTLLADPLWKELEQWAPEMEKATGRHM